VQCYIFEPENTIFTPSFVPNTAIKNLIFDLGGVILDLSVDHTLQAFSDISGIPKQKVTEIFNSSPQFDLYEKGSINDTAFRSFIRQTYGVNSSDQAIDQCWNAMLRGIPINKLHLLKRLKDKYNVYLLSNTNGIHLHYINEVLLLSITGERSLDSYFHKAYYSHRMGKRKPDADIFEQVLEENSLVAEQTLFLDDNAMSIKGANLLNIKALHVTSPDFILEYFHA
jgi:FMN phosphatase YigB (HAD superfamily)